MSLPLPLSPAFPLLAPLAAPPIVILVEPQLPENIGAVARAMLNCGLSELRLVSPREGWPQRAAWPAASGADQVLEQAQLFADLPSAMADLHYVLAATARRREQVKDVFTPDGAAAALIARQAAGQSVGLVFGRERNGLENDEVARAHGLVIVPLNPVFSSLNLAQAVLLCAYAWRVAALDAAEAAAPPVRREQGEGRPATQAELDNLFARLERGLEQGGFFTTAEQRPSMLRNLRAPFLRAELTEQEVRTLHGALVALVGARRLLQPPAAPGLPEDAAPQDGV